MTRENKLSFLVRGQYALFADPLTKAGGEKFSYQIPTYQAMKGIAESVYWKPTFVWYIDRVRVMKRIQTEAKGIRPIRYGGGNDLSIYTYLRDVAYQVEAHFEWNQSRPELAADRNEDKHYQIAKRMIERGGRRDVFLGARECQAYVEPCGFGDGKGDYDGKALAFGVMYHSMVYPGEGQNVHNMLRAAFWRAEMRDGIIKFPRPEQCRMSRDIRPMEPKSFVMGENVSGWKTVAAGEGLL